MQIRQSVASAVIEHTTRVGRTGRVALLMAGVSVWGASAALAEGELTISHGYSNFGELKYPADFPHLDYVNPDAPKGGEISIWSQGNFDSFNQYARAGVPAALNTIGSEAMLTSTSDDPYGSYCYICTTLEYPEDLSFVTFNLRDDVTFSNGTPVTAEDVAFSFNLFQTQGILEYRQVVESYIDRVEVENDYRISFYFTDQAPKGDRVSFAGGTPVFSKAWFEETGARLDESSDTPFMSTGAYVLDSFDYNRQVIYRRNPDHWAIGHPLAIGRDNFDTIRVEYFADGTAALEGFKAGEYTFRSESDPLLWATAYNFQRVEDGIVRREEIPSGAVGARFSWVFNLDRETWQDERVREAVGMMFNFEWSNQSLFSGYYRQPVSYWNGTDLEAKGPPSEGELALLEPLVAEGLFPESILTDEATAPVAHSADTSRPSRRVFRAAAKLLDEAGWPASDDGIRRNAAGETLSLNMIQFNPLYDNMILPFVENLEALGVEAKFERIDTAQYVQRRRDGDFDMTSQIFRMGFEPSGGLKQWYASETADNSSRNLMRLRNPGVDRLIDHAIAASTLEEVRIATNALDRALRSIRFDVPVRYKPDSWVAFYNYIQHPENLPPLAVGQRDFWWADQEAFEALKADGTL
jgi:microcin C transport system substrate-binding protein